MEGGLNYKTGHMYYEMNLVPHLSAGGSVTQMDHQMLWKHSRPGFH